MKILSLVIFLSFFTVKSQLNDDSSTMDQNTLALIMKQRFERIKKMPHGKKRLIAVRNFKENNLKLFNQLKKMDQTFLGIKIDLEQKKLLGNYYVATIRGVQQYISNDLENFSSTVKEKNEFTKFYGQFKDIHEKYPEIGDEYKLSIESYAHKLAAIVNSNFDSLKESINNIDNLADLGKLEKKYFSDSDMVKFLPNDILLNLIELQKKIIPLEAKKKEGEQRIRTLEAERKEIEKKLKKYN